MRRIILTLKILGSVLLVPTWSYAADRVALVIGNSAYQHVSPLPNPKNDANAISAKLEKLGFKVIKGIDMSRLELEERAREFALSARGAKVALFFYAGHGLQVNGKNYLAPVDVELADEADLDFQTVPLEAILRNMERERRTNLVFLDACRNNPLARNLARSMGTRSAEVGRGLARIETGVGTMIAFATQPGNVALDGDGHNSPFTEALLNHIETPNVDIALMMRKVREDVMAATNDQQVPWSNSSLIGTFAFNGDAASGGQASGTVPADRAAQAWAAIKDSQDQSVFNAFIEEFPDGLYSALARSRLKTLQGQAAENKVAALPVQPPELPNTSVSHAARPIAAGEDCVDSNSNLICASSVLSPQGRNTYRVANLTDNRPETAWVEGSSDHGVGQWILVEFNDVRTVHGLQLRNGYTKNGDIYSKNSRVRDVQIIFSGGEQIRRTLADTGEPQYITFDADIPAKWLQMKILSVYPGSKYSDTAISELQIDAN